MAGAERARSAASTGARASAARLRALEPQGAGRARRAARWQGRRKAPTQSDSVLRELIERRSFREPFKRPRADFTANIIRNVWSHAIIFCGHFPDQTYTFTQEETEDETRGARVRPPAARRGEHRGRPAVPRDQRQPRLPGRAPPLPGHAVRPATARSPRACARSASATSCRTTRARSGSSRHGAAHDRPAGVPGGKPRPKPGPYKGDEDQGKGERADMVESQAAS